MSIKGPTGEMDDCRPVLMFGFVGQVSIEHMSE